MKDVPAGVTSTEQSSRVRVSVPDLTTAISCPRWVCQPVDPPGATVISRKVTSVRPLGVLTSSLPSDVPSAWTVPLTPLPGVATAAAGTMPSAATPAPTSRALRSTRHLSRLVPPALFPFFTRSCRRTP